jgi:hypothetical protein
LTYAPCEPKIMHRGYELLLSGNRVRGSRFVML